MILICTGLRLLDFSFGQCVYVSLETNITNHLCQRIQVSGGLCLWPGWMQGCLVKGWWVTDHMTEIQSSSMFNTLGGVRQGVGKNTEAATVTASWGPQVNFQPQGWRSWVAGVFQAHRCPRRALLTARTVALEPCGRHGGFSPEIGRGEGVPRKQILATYLRADPLGVAMP